MNNYVVYTDSGCDIAPELLKEWGVYSSSLTFRCVYPSAIRIIRKILTSQRISSTVCWSRARSSPHSAGVAL